jgi:hypothetical protein
VRVVEADYLEHQLVTQQMLGKLDRGDQGPAEAAAAKPSVQRYTAQGSGLLWWPGEKPLLSHPEILYVILFQAPRPMRRQSKKPSRLNLPKREGHKIPSLDEGDEENP